MNIDEEIQKLKPLRMYFINHLKFQLIIGQKRNLCYYFLILGIPYKIYQN
ncbi:unnamed protein product [Paramecium sonneborni]|uniref:Uncharacterized protein n=1 Tax=Paramecium sonneborni TaxID=65129 RepID=A0A8S1RLB0_9CILI|nr:unnamed protein product [Paramecium sonneborni]